MKTITLTFAISLFCAFHSIGQINPVQNLTWSQWYEMPNNFFILEWEEPAQPHDELIGYNIYRENDLYMFLSGENSIYNIESIMGIVTNCGGVAFLMYGPPSFNVHVTAVYNPGAVESDYIETVEVHEAALKLQNFNYQKPMIYPNPSRGIINIENKDLDRIIVYDLSGKIIKEIKPQAHIDLSNITKGIYLVKLISGNKTLVEKIILE